MAGSRTTWALGLALAIGCWVLAAVVTPSPAAAHEHEAYQYEGGVAAVHDNWMRDVPDDTYLHDMSIPGTHDSGADTGGEYTRTQGLTIAEQLDAGIRFLDVRARHIEDVFAIHHDEVFLDLMFGDVMNDVVDFLDDHPSETVVMRLKQEHTEQDTTRSFTETFEWYMERNGAAYGQYLHGFDADYDFTDFPRLGEVRGKVFLLQDWTDDCSSYGPCWPTIEDSNSWFDIQDDYTLSTNFALHGKFDKVKTQLYKANNSSDDRFFVNFLSGTGGTSPPHFVASGHEGPRTDAARQTTGRTVGLWGETYWDDFPHTACAYNPVIWDTDCTISYEGTNVLTHLWLNNLRYRNRQEGTQLAFPPKAYPVDWQRLGIVVADFPGHGLIESIIDKNPVARPPDIQLLGRPTREGGFIRFDASGTGGFNDQRRLVMADVDRRDHLPDFVAPRVMVALVGPARELVVRIHDLAGPDLSDIRVIERTEDQLVDISGMTVQEFKDTWVVGHVEPDVAPDQSWLTWSASQRREIMDVAARMAGHTFAATDAGLQFAFEFDVAGPPACLDPSFTGWTTDPTTARAYPDDELADGSQPTVTVCARDSQKLSLHTIDAPVLNAPPRFALRDQVIDPDGAARLQSSITDPGADEFSLSIDWDRTDPDRPVERELGTDRTIDESHTFTGLAGVDLVEADVMVRDDDGGSHRDVVRFHVDRGRPIVTIDNADDDDPDDDVLEVEDPTVTITGLLGGCRDQPVTLQVTWGDGESETFTYPAGTTEYRETHDYPGNGDRPFVAWDLELEVSCGGQSTTITPRVAVSNLPPILAVQPPSPTTEGSPLTLGGRIDELDAEEGYTVEVDWGDGMVETFEGDDSRSPEFEPAGGAVHFRFAHVYDDDDPTGTPFDDYPVRVTITDADGGTATRSVAATVGNVAPDPSAEATTDGNGTVVLRGDLDEPGTNDPVEMHVDWGDGTLSDLSWDGRPTWDQAWTVDHTYDDEGLYLVRINGRDDDSGTFSLVVPVAVRFDGPTITGLAGDRVDEDGTATVSGTFEDPTPDDAFTVAIDWGEGEPTEHDYPAGSTSFSETHQYLDDDPTGTASDDHEVVVTVTDDTGGFDQDATTVTVDNVAPTITATGDEVAEGEAATVTGTISDPGTQDTFTLEADWGDGPVGAGALPAGTDEFSIELDDAEVGTHTVLVTITDDDGGTATTTAAITVVPLEPEITSITGDTVDEGGLATVSGTFEDATPNDTFTVTIDWGEGDPVDYDYPAGSTSFSETHTYLDDDPSGTPSDVYPIGVTVADASGSSDTGETAVTVHNVAPTITATGDEATEGGTATVTGTISDPGSLDTFSLDVDWGDGSSVEAVPLPTGAEEWSLDHSYAVAGTYTVELLVADDDGGTATAPAEVTVLPSVPNITSTTGDTVDEDGTATVSGTFEDTTPGDTFTVTIDWGEGDLVDYHYPAGSTSFSETHQYLDDDPSGTPSDDYPVVATVADAAGHVAEAATTVTVDNVAPVVEIHDVAGPAGSQLGPDGWPVVVHAEVDLGGSLADVGTLDTHEVEVDWGDGSVEPVGSAAGAFTGTHSWATAGTRTVTVTAVDDDTGTASDTVEVDVLDACGAVDLVVARLHAQDTGGEQPALDRRLRRAITRLVGRDGGTGSDGACDHLADGRTAVAMVRFRQATRLLLAGNHPGFDGLRDATLVAQASRSVATELVHRAEDQASNRFQERRLADAREVMATGDAHLATGEPVAAVTDYRAAVRHLHAWVP